MIIPLPKFRNLIMPALVAGLIGVSAYDHTRSSPAPVNGSAVSIGSAVITVQQPCPPEPGPAPEPTPTPIPVPCPCPDPSPVPAPIPTPDPEPSPVPPPAPVVVPIPGPLFASLIYDGTSIDAAVQTAEIRTDQTILSQISTADYKGWHVYESTHPAMSSKTADNPHGLGLSTMVTIQPGMAVVLVQGPDGHKVTTFPAPIKADDLVGSLRSIKYGGNP